MCANSLSPVYYHPCFTGEEIKVLWECTSQSSDTKHMTYSLGSREVSLVKQLFSKVWARIRESRSGDAVPGLGTVGRHGQPRAKREQRWTAKSDRTRREICVESCGLQWGDAANWQQPRREGAVEVNALTPSYLLLVACWSNPRSQLPGHRAEWRRVGGGLEGRHPAWRGRSFPVHGRERV